MLRLLLLTATTATGEAAASAPEPAAGGPASWQGRRWHTPPQYTPTCVPGGIFAGTEQDPTRTFSCGSEDPSPPEFESATTLKTPRIRRKHGAHK